MQLTVARRLPLDTMYNNISRSALLWMTHSEVPKALFCTAQKLTSIITNHSWVLKHMFLWKTQHKCAQRPWSPISMAKNYANANWSDTNIRQPLRYSRISAHLRIWKLENPRERLNTWKMATNFIEVQTITKWKKGRWDNWCQWMPEQEWCTGRTVYARVSKQSHRDTFTHVVLNDGDPVGSALVYDYDI